MNPQPLDVQSFIDAQPVSRCQWSVFALCFAIMLLDGFDTAAIGYVAPSLLQEWGIARPALAPVLSAALFGLAGGGLLAGPLADRFGRKRVIVGAVALFGLGCLACAFVGGLDTLVAWRFVTGIGLGAAMPNALTMTSEFVPLRRRALMTNAMFCGFPLGAALGGFLAAWMIPLWGWRSVFVLGGVAPLVLLVAILVVMPESVRYLVVRGAPAARIRVVLRRISPAAETAEAFALAEGQRGSDGRKGLALVLSRSYVLGSAMLWVAYFMGLVVFYSLINWMPVLFKDAGLDARQATLVAALFPLGGVGAVVSGWLMDRRGADRVVAICYGLTALAVFAIGQLAGSIGALVVAVLLAGIVMNTGQASMGSLAAAFYPTAGRATGISWMLGVGRFGGIAGSFLVAELAARQLPFDRIFTTISLAGAIAALALAIKARCHPEAAETHPVAAGNHGLAH